MPAERHAAIDWNDAASALSFPRIMIAALVEILLFQGLGELAAHFFLTFIPGPVIGLVLLTGFLVVRARVNAPLDELATAFSRHFGLLFVPAAVGVVMFWPHLKTHAVAIAAALVASVVLTVAVTALVLKGLSRGQGK
jgi:holin-like protein